MLTKLEGEVWKDVVDYEGLYAVSNLGRVKSLNYRRTGQERILKPSKNKYGYLRVGLWKNGKQKTHKVHRLVALAFVDNPMPLLLTEVNHLDEDKENNFVFINPDGSVDEAKSNLEWCDRKTNINYGTHNERVAAARSKPVEQCTLDGELVRVWTSTKEAGRNGFNQSTVSKCCNGKRRAHKGFLWRHK